MIVDGGKAVDSRQLNVERKSQSDQPGGNGPVGERAWRAGEATRPRRAAQMAAPEAPAGFA